MANKTMCMPWYVLPILLFVFILVSIGFLLVIYCKKNKSSNVVFLQVPEDQRESDNFVYGNRNSGNSNQIRAAPVS